MYLYPIYKDVGNSALNESGQYTREQSFWESTSNLDKGMRLDTMLRDLGFQTKMSRIRNTTEDDRSLSAISAEAINCSTRLMFVLWSHQIISL
jgi:hypothetical protein